MHPTSSLKPLNQHNSLPTETQRSSRSSQNSAIISQLNANQKKAVESQITSLDNT